MDRKKAQAIVDIIETLKRANIGANVFPIVSLATSCKGIEKYWREIKAFAEGEEIEMLGCDEWVPVCDPSFASNMKYRVAKPKIKVNGIEVPAPEYSPEEGKVYYVIDAKEQKGYRLRRPLEYADYYNAAKDRRKDLAPYQFDNLVKRGFVYANENDARERARAEFEDLRDWGCNDG